MNAPSIDFGSEANLESMRVVCAVLARALYRAPDREWLEALVCNRVFEDVPFAASHPEAQSALTVLRDWAGTCSAGVGEPELGRIDADYHRLFIGPGKLLAAPWESVYVDRERLLFQRVTLEVKAWYERFGLALESACNEPADHIGLELSFVSHLAREALAALANRKDGAARSLVEAQRGFVREHLGRWAPNWCRDVEKHAATPFFRGVGRLTRAVVKELAVEARRNA